MKTRSSRPATKLAGREAVPKKIVRKTATKRITQNKVTKKAVPKKPVAKKTVVKKVAPKKPRAKITIEPTQNIIIGDDDDVGVELRARATARSFAPSRVSNRRSAVDRVDDPPHPADPETSLVERVSHAIERELSKIEIIIGSSRVPPMRRTEVESRARVLASLARTLKEVKRLREQEREDILRIDDDAMPRDLDELRSELARRLEILVGEAKTLHPDAAE